MNVTAGRTYKQLRASLSIIPDEIIEHIAHNLRGDTIDEESYAECYILDNCTDFSNTRFHLSSFSKVCTSVRWPVERALYRDIHLHFDGWNGTHDLIHPEWHAGSLRLLLRTLEGRVDLRACVRSVQMDWYDEMLLDLEEKDLAPIEDALRQFFSRCPSVQRLNIMTFPSEIFSEIATSSQITTVATSGPLSMFHTVMDTFPLLQDLFLNVDCMDSPTTTYTSLHHLKKLTIESTQTGVPCVFWALEICGHITEELHMTCSGYFFPDDERSPSPVLLTTLSPSAGTNLRSLRLAGDQLNFLANPSSSLAQAIRQLPSLRYLHMSRCLSFHPAAFSVLPPSLRCLFLSEYGEWVDNNGHSRRAFIVALGNCLAQATRAIEMVATHSETEDGFESHSHLQRVCNVHNIKFHLDIHPNDDREIRIICKSFLNTIQP